MSIRICESTFAQDDVDDITQYQPCELEGVGRDAAAHGGFADIFKATLNDVQVAVKVVRVIVGDHPQLEKRKKYFARELSCWAKLKHKNILPLMGICFGFKERYLPALISPWIHYSDSADFISERKLDVDFLAFIIGIADGLRHAHSLNIIHGDLRNNNVLVTQDGVPLIADWGLSKALQQDTPNSLLSLTSHGGNARWYPVECFKSTDSTNRHESARSTQTDIWGIALVIKMLFSGKMPYSECSNELAVPIFIRENGQPEFHPPQNPEWEAFQEALNDLCKECWKEDRTERPSMDDVICRLREIKSDYSDDDSVQSSEEASTPRLGPLVLDDGNVDEIAADFAATLRLSRPTEEKKVGPDIPHSPIAENNSSRRNGSSSLPTVLNVDYKTQLNNYLAGIGRLHTLKYSSEKPSSGPPHDPRHFVTLYISGEEFGRGSGKKKKLAENEASRNALHKIQSKFGDYLSTFEAYIEDNSLQVRYSWTTTCVEEDVTLRWTAVLYKDGADIGFGSGLTERAAKSRAAEFASLRWPRAR